MPLMTELKRDGVRLEVPWAEYHLRAICDAAYKERGDHKVLNDVPYTFKEDHEYGGVSEDTIIQDGDPEKEYTFEIKAGDVFNCWRSF